MPAAIGESNKGYKLLKKMGWQPGFGSQPIIGVMRPKKHGLGYETNNQAGKSSNFQAGNIGKKF